jgi:tetratricopeptide (TPR) repeat protein
VRLAALLERTLRGVTGAGHIPTPAMLFRRADRLRAQGRYDEAAQLVARGLRQVPDSTVGHLISAYLAMATRTTARARSEFQRVLTADPYHPRALLGLARIHIEDQDPEGAKILLDRALQYHTDFAEARALREMLGGWSRTPVDLRAPPARAALAAAPGRDVIALRGDGRVILTGPDEERGRQLAQHVMQVHRAAAATLSRAGLGSLRSAAIDTGAGMTVLLKDADLVFSATLDGAIEVGAGLAQVARLRADLGVKA